MDSFWDFFVLAISVMLMFAYLLVLFQIIGDLFADRSVSGGMKALWIVGLLVLPFLTALLYLVLRGASMGERQVARVQSMQADSEAWVRSVASASTADEIAKAKALLDAGTIDQAEFDALKAKSLA